jgi:metallo-beta-lactamase class B
MRNWIILIIMSCFPIIGVTQIDYKRIKISSDIELIKLSENAYIHISFSNIPEYGRFSSNGLIFLNGSKAFLFDTPMTDSLTKILVTWLKDSLGLTIVGFVPNHWHNDCMGGLNFIQGQGIESYANQMTIDIARSKKLPVPDHGFKDSLDLMLGDKIIQCFYFGAAHSRDNIVVWIPSEQVLFAGCMIKSINSQDLGNMVDGDLNAYSETIGMLMNKFQKAKFVIPGHGSFGGLELIKHTRDLLKK